MKHTRENACIPRTFTGDLVQGRYLGIFDESGHVICSMNTDNRTKLLIISHLITLCISLCRDYYNLLCIIPIL